MFKYVQISAFWRAENEFSDRRNLPQRLHVVKDVECICVGIRKIYEAHLSPTLIIDKSLI